MDVSPHDDAPKIRKPPAGTGGSKPTINVGTTIIRKESYHDRINPESQPAPIHPPQVRRGQRSPGYRDPAGNLPASRGGIAAHLEHLRGSPLPSTSAVEQGRGRVILAGKGAGIHDQGQGLPDLAEGVQKALDMALMETGGRSGESQREDRYASSREGSGAPF